MRKGVMGEVMVSRQFSRRFGMPQNVKKEGIVSNLSQDGVMVITMPKEQRIEEVKRFQTRAGWTTLTVPVRCKGDEEASPRPAGRETPVGEERWWLRGETKGRRGGGAGRETSRFQ